MGKEAATTRRQPNRGITAKLLEKFGKSPGEVLYLSDLAQEFGATPEAIQQSMSNIIARQEGDAYQAHIKARAWVYRPNGAPKADGSRRVFEELAVTKTGDVILQDEAGNLWRAKELE